METIELQVELRQGNGKGAARKVRRQGKLPAVLYGPKRQCTLIQLEAKQFRSKVAAVEGSRLLRLQCPHPDIDGRVALVKEIQRHPLSDDLLHADLYEVDLQKKLTVSVPLHFVGKAAGVELGGILQPILREIEVSCLPTDIPEFFEVDVSQLGIHDAIHAGQIKLPPGVELEYDTDFTLVTVLPPTVEEVKVTEEAAAPTAEEAAAAAAEAPEAEKGDKKKEPEAKRDVEKKKKED
jgi:large subunit ribosomal protein L25